VFNLLKYLNKQCKRWPHSLSCC